MQEKPKRDPELQTSLLPDGHAVIVNPKNDWANTISPLGAIVWEYCDGSNSLEDIVRLVAEAAEVSDRSALQKEIQSFIDQFEEEGFFLD